MSIKSKVLASAATLALVGGVTTAGVLGSATAGNAATPSCGRGCADIFSQEYGHHSDPGFLLDVFQQKVKVNQPVILYRASNNDPAEDFTLTDAGSVADFYQASEVGQSLGITAAVALHYGCIAGVTFYDCYGLTTVPDHGDLSQFADPSPCSYKTATDGVCQAFFNFPAFEIEYTPEGQDTGLCVGVAKTAFQEEGVTLQVCGVSANTIWIIDQFISCENGDYGNVIRDGGEACDNADASFLNYQELFHGYFPLVNGSDTNFSQPYVLTYPQSGYPTDKPRPQLQVDQLSGYTTGGYPSFINFPSIDDNQVWAADFGD